MAIGGLVRYPVGILILFPSLCVFSTGTCENDVLVKYMYIHVHVRVEDSFRVVESGDSLG